MMRIEIKPWKCAIQGCNREWAGYYDLTVTGIGDFLLHCDDPMHKEAVYAEGKRIDEARKRRYQEQKEWEENYLVIPTDEL